MEGIKDLALAFLVGCIIGMRFLRNNKKNSNPNSKETISTLFLAMHPETLPSITLPFFLASITISIKEKCDKDCNKVIDCPILKEGFVLMIEMRSLLKNYKICLT